MEPQPASFSLRRITRSKDRFEIFLIDANAIVLHLEDEKILLDTGPDLNARRSLEPA